MSQIVGGAKLNAAISPLYGVLGKAQRSVRVGIEQYEFVVEEVTRNGFIDNI